MKNKVFIKAVAAALCFITFISCAGALAASAFESVEAGKLNIVIDGGTERKEVKAGDEIEIKVNLVNNTAISSLKARISWPEALQLVNAEYNIYNKDDSTELAIEPDAGADGKPDWGSVTDHFAFNWISAFGEFKGDVTYVTLTFKVKADAKAGEFLPITAEIDPENVFDKDANDIPFKLINGGVYVSASGGDNNDQTDKVTDAETAPEPGQKSSNSTVIIIVIIAAVVICAAVIAIILIKKRKAAE